MISYTENLPAFATSSRLNPAVSRISLQKAPSAGFPDPMQSLMIARQALLKFSTINAFASFEGLDLVAMYRPLSGSLVFVFIRLSLSLNRAVAVFRNVGNSVRFL